MPDIIETIDAYFNAELLRKEILDHFGFEERWRLLPLVDARDSYWAVDRNERNWIRFSPNSFALVHWLTHDEWDAEDLKNQLYSSELIPGRASKAVYRGETLALVVVDTNTDGNKWIEVRSIEREFKLLPAWEAYSR